MSFWAGDSDQAANVPTGIRVKVDNNVAACDNAEELPLNRIEISDPVSCRIVVNVAQNWGQTIPTNLLGRTIFGS